VVDGDLRRPEPGRPSTDVAVTVGSIAQSCRCDEVSKEGRQGVVLKSPATIWPPCALYKIRQIVELEVLLAGFARIFGRR